MLHVLGGLCVGGVALAGIGLLVDWFEEEACAARKEWRERSEELARETDSCNRELERQLTTSAQSVEFERLRTLHYKSCRMADLAYRSLREGRSRLHQLNGVLRQSAQDKAALREIARHGSPLEKRQAQDTLRSVNALRRQLFCERDDAVESHAALLARVRELNSNTRQLKLQIRDRCGHGGRVWFDRLEQRKGKRIPSKTLP